MRQRPEMYHRVAARRRMPDLSKIQQIHAVHTVQADHLMAEALQMPSDRHTNMPAMPGDENAHTTMISRDPTDAWQVQEDVDPPEGATMHPASKS